MEYRTLECESPQKIHLCFRDAFFDYIIQIEFPFEKYQQHLRRYGVDLSLSVGAYDGDELVGFTLNGTGEWNGKPTLYDAGTGMIKDYRGKGHAKQIFTTLREMMSTTIYSQYLLEVIQGNTPAYNLYTRQGFKTQREFSCFKLPKEDYLRHVAASTEPTTDTHLGVTRIESPDWNHLSSFWNFKPSWQNALDAVERVRTDVEVIGAYRGGECVGYAVFDARRGDIPQLAVRPDSRRQGIGTLLLDSIADAIVPSTDLRIINVEKTDRETMEFFLAKRFENDVDQYEMLLT